MSEAKESQKPAYHHGDLRRALIDAARDLVEEHGPDQFSVAEAARVAGVSKAAPYKHFSDREEMLLAVVMDAMDRKYDAMQAEIAKFPEGSPEQIVALGRVYVAFAVGQPNLFRLVFGLSEQHQGVDYVVDKGSRTLRLVQETVAKVLGFPDVNAEAEHKAFMLWSFVHGLSFLQIDGKVSSLGLNIDIERMLEEIGLRVLAPLSGHQKPATPPKNTGTKN